jgi:hypothetical protein
MPALFLETSQRNKCATAAPLVPAKQTTNLPEATWDMRILVVWNKAVREQLITNNIYIR